MNNPYKSSMSSMSPQQSFRYGGIGRLSYILISIFINILPFVLIGGLAYTSFEYDLALDLEFSEKTELIIIVGYFVLFHVPVYYRLKNIGMNPWWCLLSIVPFVNIVIGLGYLVCQEGYQDTKKLDFVGKILIFVGLVIILLAVLGLIYLNNEA